jgi:hypothetical protein
MNADFISHPDATIDSPAQDYPDTGCYARSYDRQLWLSSSGQTWIARWERMRSGVARYDLYVYTPGDGVWNLIGSYTEWPFAETAKNEWVSYVEQGGTYQMWLDGQRCTS